MVYRTESKQWQPLALSWITWNGKKSTWTRCADQNEVKKCKDSETWWKMTEEWDAEITTTPSTDDGNDVEAKPAWWKMTEEWDEEIKKATKEDGNDVKAKQHSATRPTRRSRH